jgi:hypothetical protein
MASNRRGAGGDVGADTNQEIEQVACLSDEVLPLWFGQHAKLNGESDIFDDFLEFGHVLLKVGVETND